MPSVVISPITIGNHTQIYANGSVGHDTSVDDYCFIANNASVGGWINLGGEVHVRSDCSIREHITIGKWAIIRLGAVVLGCTTFYCS